MTSGAPAAAAGTPSPRAPLLPRLGALALALCWLALAYGPILADLRAPARAAPVALAALAAGGAAALLAWRARGDLVARALLAPPRWLYLTLVAAAGVALTLYYQHGAMRGLFVSRDASVYVLQARALAHGTFGVPVPPPRLAWSAHFLFEGADGRLHGVFAPGYPLFLAPFTRAGWPLLAGPVTAVLMVLAQYALARRVLRDELLARASLLLPLPSFARTTETGDLLSHAFVAALAAAAAALLLALLDAPPTPGTGAAAAAAAAAHRRRADAWRAAAFGACVGWLASARLLDGLIIGSVLGAALLAGVARRRVPARRVAVALAAALPFVLLVAAQQRVATGSFTRATSVEYARRADHPPTCLRLGFGRDVGCVVEHTRERAAFGDDGYTPDDALRIVRERTGVLGNDLFGFAPLALLALAGLLLSPAPRLLLCGAIPLALTLGYGLFYYGNAPVFGARHVFPAAPFLYVAAAAALGALARVRRVGPRGVGAATAALLAAATAGALPLWREGQAMTREWLRRREDPRRAMARAGITRGIVVTHDLNSYLAGLDPWGDGPDRMLVIDDRAGMFDLRRFRPDLPMYLYVARRPTGGPLLRVDVPPPPPGLRVEFERAWPSFVRVAGLGVASIDTLACCRVPTSGEHVLFLFEASPGAELAFPFDLAREGRYALRVEGLAGDDYGEYELAVDGVPFAQWRGWASRRQPRASEPAPPRWLARGAHRFTARCTGRAPQSRGYVAAFDTLIGEAAP